MKRPAWLLVAFCVCSGCFMPPYRYGSLDQLYPQAPRPALKTVASADHTLRYAELEQYGAPRIVFIHGSPGDWEGFADYLKRPELRRYGPLLVPDRPGYGGSEAQQAVIPLAEQARRLASLLDGAGAPAIVVGHSLGGAIAAKLAMDYPDRVRGVLLLAPAVAPQYEEPRWYQHVADWNLMRWLLPQVIVNANDELMPLPAELRAMQPGWSQLRMPVYVVQGGRDTLVDPRTADFLERELVHAPHRIWRYADAGHLFVWEQPDHAIAALQALIAASGALP